MKRVTRSYVDLRSQLVVFDKWFFVSQGEKPAVFSKSESAVVRNGEDFGFLVLYGPMNRMIPVEIRLHVPSHPENFGCSNVDPREIKILNNNVVCVRQMLDAREYQSFGWYWGISKDDPRGWYKLSFSLDGWQIREYAFKVV